MTTTDDTTAPRRIRRRGTRMGAAPLGEVELLAAAAHRLRACHGITELAQLVAETLLELLHPRRAIVSRVENDRARTLWSSPPVGDPALTPLADRTWTAETWPALRVLAEPDVWRAGPGDEDAERWLGPLGASAAASVPVVVNQSVWGLLTVTRLSGDFTDEDVALVEVVAALAAATLVRLDFDNQVQHMLVEDPLTGLADRRVADTAAETALSSGVETVIVMCDVDGLKQVNDQLGHGEGDELLRLVADVLRKAAEALPGATPARIGGDEFCLVVPGWPKRTVEEVMVATLDENPLPHDAAISWGLAASAVGERVAISTLFRSADFAQYRVKRARARRRQLALPAAADPAMTAQQLLARAVPAILAARGELGRVCALAATATDTLGGGAWTVLRDGAADTAPVVVARGGSPAGDEDPALGVVARQDGWRIEVGASTESSHHPQVLTALQAALFVAAHEVTSGT